VFCLQYVGAGKVLFHATDETWRWRYRWATFSSPAIGFKPFGLSAARNWPTPVARPCLPPTVANNVQGEPVRLRVRFADERLAPAEDDGVTVVVEQAGRQTQRVVLRRAVAGCGVFECQLDRLDIGIIMRGSQGRRWKRCRHRPISR